MDNITPKILTLPEAALFLHVKISWLVRRENWQAYGGVKMAGRIVFPDERELYDRIFNNDKKENQGPGKKRKGLEVRLSAKGSPISKSELYDQDSRKGSGRKEAGGTEEPADYKADLFNLL
jgi:hypothetical protein